MISARVLSCPLKGAPIAFRHFTEWSICDKELSTRPFFKASALYTTKARPNCKDSLHPQSVKLEMVPSFVISRVGKSTTLLQFQAFVFPFYPPQNMHNFSTQFVWLLDIKTCLGNFVLHCCATWPRNTYIYNAEPFFRVHQIICGKSYTPSIAKQYVVTHCSCVHMYM